MYWNPEKYLEGMYSSSKPMYTFQAQDQDQWLQWKSELKEVFINDLGGFPESKTDLNPKMIEQIDCGDYSRIKFVLTTDQNLEMPTYILMPKQVPTNGTFPAIVACHGHGHGARAAIGLNPDDTEMTDQKECHNSFALELVKRGFLVIVPELLGFGDRRLKEDLEKAPNQSSCNRMSSYLLMFGKTLAGVRVYEVMRAIDYLETREDVNTDRIGIMGLSGGGLVCSFVSALDERVKATVISGFTNTFKDSIMAMHHCIDNYVPGILKHAELPELIGLIAPKPLFIEAGEKDHIFPLHGVKKAYSHIGEIYERIGRKQRLELHIHENGHEVCGERAYPWLEKWLRH